MAGLLVLGACAATWPMAERTLRSAALLARLMSPDAPPEWTTHVLSEPVRQRLALPLGSSTVNALLYRPPDENRSRGGIVLLHGVHPRGIEEPRLQAFARSLAAAGVHVLTPELPELIAYRIEASTVSDITAAARAHALRLGQGSVGVVGISFAGGLALLAAARQTGAEPIGFVVTVGAHHDLLRLTRYYAGQTVRGPDGAPAQVTPHPYGARVLMREHLERFFSAQDVPLARRALDTYLRDQHRKAREQALQLSDAGQQTMASLLRNTTSPELAKMLLSAAEAAAPALAAASPKGQLSALHVPVFLAHGESDPIIPSLETRWLAREVPQEALRDVVITKLLRHAEFPEPPALWDTWELVSFMSQVLSAAQMGAADPLSDPPAGP